MFLVLGKNGMLGSELCKLLEKQRIKYEALDYPDIDVTNIDNVRNKISDNYTVVFNCTAYTNVDGAEDDYLNCFKVNANGSKNIAIICEEINAKMVHVSTDYVFDGDKQGAYNECDIANPKSVYGATKYLGENYIREFCSKYFILRTAWLFGHGGNNFIETMIKLSDREELKVINDQHGTPTTTLDLANVMIELSKTDNYGIYHATGQGETTWYGFAKYIFETLELCVNLIPCTSEEFVTKAVRPKNSVLDNMGLKSIDLDLMRDWKIVVSEYLENRNK